MHRNSESLLFLECPEGLLAVAVPDSVVALPVFFNSARVDELTHQTRSDLAGRPVFLHQPDLLLQDVVLRQLGLGLLRFNHFLLAFRLNLRLRAPPLAAGLQQLGRVALGGCGNGN